MALEFLKDPPKRGWALVIALGLLAVALAGPFVYARDARHLSAYRDGDEDISLARVALEGRAARIESFVASPAPLREIRDAHGHLLVIAGAELRYDAAEAAEVVAFMRRGGSVILADEKGYGSDIAHEAGFAISGQRVLDTRSHLGDPELVVTDATVGDQSFRVLFNQASSIRVLSNAGAYTVLASSSVPQFPTGSYHDANGNGEIDISDDPGPFPLAVRTRVGEGTLVLIADTGVLMNEQLRLVEYGNGNFLAALAGDLVLRDSGVILIDESRHPGPAPLAPWDAAARALARATLTPLAATVTTLLLVLSAFAAWRMTRPTDDWSHHTHDLGHLVPTPDHVRPDLARAQRMAQRRVSERFNIPIEQVAAMPADQLAALTGDKLLAEAAAGTLRSDPAPLFRQFSSSSVLTPEANP